MRFYVLRKIFESSKINKKMDDFESFDDEFLALCQFRSLSLDRATTPKLNRCLTWYDRNFYRIRFRLCSIILKVSRKMYLKKFFRIKRSFFADGWLKTKNSHLNNLQPVNGKATAFVCANFSCSLPVTTSEELKRLIDENLKKK